MLKDARRRHRLTQSAAAVRAGISQSEWSGLERGKQQAMLPTINRAAFAVGGSLDAFVRETSAADEPRDAVHLRAQELVMRTAAPGDWRGLPEEAIDREARTSRRADVLLHRISAIDGVAEYAISEIEDWIDDVGRSVRDFARRLDALERYAIARMRGEEPVPRTGGCWIVRATRGNRRLVAEHRHFFRARFPGSGRAWLAALTDAMAPLPRQPALLWISVDGTRILPARLG